MPAKYRFGGQIARGNHCFCLVPAKCCRQDWADWEPWGPAVRWISLTMAVAVLAASVGGAAAQYYPPPDYQPPPPPGYVGGPVYRDARGVPINPRYVQPAPGEEVYDGPPPYGRSFFPAQPMPVLNGGLMQRPPSDLADVSGSADVTGTVRGAAVAPEALPPGYIPGGNAAPPRSNSTVIASLPPEDQPEQGPRKELPERFRRQI